MKERQIDIGMRPRPRCERFVRGPIPYEWLAAAGRLPGKATQVAIVLVFLAGVLKNNTFKVQPSRFREFGVGRLSANRCLKLLEAEGLIKVQRKGKTSPTVTVIFESDMK